MKYLETYKGVKIYKGKNKLGDESYIFYDKLNIEHSFSIKWYQFSTVKRSITNNIKLGNIIVK